MLFNPRVNNILDAILGPKNHPRQSSPSVPADNGDVFQPRHKKKKKPSPVVPPPDTSWANRMPLNTTELLRQLSANVGKMPMPGGLSGAVRIPAFGSSQPATQGFDPFTYGQDGGEATFFNQTMDGGMAPITAVPTNIGYPKGWDPLGIAPVPVADTKQSKKRNRPITL